MYSHELSSWCGRAETPKTQQGCFKCGDPLSDLCFVLSPTNGKARLFCTPCAMDVRGEDENVDAALKRSLTPAE
jgi:hypothetical protein